MRTIKLDVEVLAVETFVAGEAIDVREAVSVTCATTQTPRPTCRECTL